MLRPPGDAELRTPNLPYISGDFPDRTRHAHVHARVVARLGIAIQALAIVSGAYAWSAAGGSAGPLRMGLAAALITALVIDRGILAQLKWSAAEGGPRVFEWIVFCGWFCLAIGGAVLVTLLGRVSDSAYGWLLYAVFLWYLGSWWADLTAHSLGPETYALWLSERRRTAWRLVGIGIALTPAVAGWTAASLDVLVWPRRADTIRSWIEFHPAAPHPCRPWGTAISPIEVAATLSGGGYRAALSHAGLLAALDDQCVPVHLLSTVSGGSIVGAAYALGMPPQEFARILSRRRPGLPDDILSLFNLPVGATRKYQRHFERVFFGERTIGDLPESPKLLINVTNLDADAASAREIVTNHWAPEEANDTRIANAVAASAAFPGVFGPVQFPWVKSNRESVARAHFLVDGGVVENWGVEGLRQYLSGLRGFDWNRIHPSILIVSDASAYSQAPEKLPIQPSADQALVMANAIQFAGSQRLTFAELTGVDDLSARMAFLPVWRRYSRIDYPSRYMPPELAARFRVGDSAKPRLATIVVPITRASTAELLKTYPCAGPRGISGVEIQRLVRTLPTLDELSPSQAADAFWLGYALGNLYGQTIECARREISGYPCMDLPDRPALRCPSW